MTQQTQLKDYEQAEFEVVLLDISDIICTSGKGMINDLIEDDEEY